MTLDRSCVCWSSPPLVQVHSWSSWWRGENPELFSYCKYCSNAPSFINWISFTYTFTSFVSFLKFVSSKIISLQVETVSQSLLPQAPFYTLVFCHCAVILRAEQALAIMMINTLEQLSIWLWPNSMHFEQRRILNGCFYQDQPCGTAWFH